MASDPYRSALKTLNWIAEKLATASPAEFQSLLQLLHQTVELLARSGRCRLSTASLARRVDTLDQDLEKAGLSAAERAKAIQERLGLSKSHYYRLRKIGDSH